MQEHLKFYIDGEWVDPATPATLDVINPTTEAPFATISMGSAADVEKAVAAAKTAFESFSKTSVQERMELLGAILGEYTKRYDEIAAAISTEMGAPIWLSKAAQAATGQAHFATTLELLKTYAWEEKKGAYLLRKEPVGVCGLITPWNWPINQISCKVAPALAAGCTMVLKPSEVAPVNAILLAEILDAAGVPKGVFNLVNGDGPSVGEAMSSHPDIHMMSFTGSTRAGVLVAKAAADTVKRVSQELGGKSANIVLEDADLQTAVAGGVSQVMTNSGQSCNAPTRMLVPKAKHDEALQIAKAAAEGVKPGDPFTDGTVIGPVVSEVQFEKIQGLIQKGIDEGATLVAGGTGRPDGLNAGYFVKPTVFGDVNNDMTIAREEIFGPVLSILPYETEAEAIEIANDTPYVCLAMFSLAVWITRLRLPHRSEPVMFISMALDLTSAHLLVATNSLVTVVSGGELGFEEFLETKAMFVPAA